MNETPEDYERQLERDRARIGQTVEEIQNRLSPGELLDQALQYARSGGSEAATVLARSARQNPWPLMLTGVGLVWLMASTAMSQNRRDTAEYRGSGYRAREGDDGYREYREYGDATYSAYASGSTGRSDMAERARAAAAAVQRQAGEAEDAFQARVTEAKAQALSLKRRAEETAEAFGDRVESYMRRAGESVQRAQDTVSDLGRRARSAMDRGTEAVGEQARMVRAGAETIQTRVRELYQSEPLIVGAIGVAAGALISMLLPSTEAEDRLMGEYGEQVRSKASEMASTAVEQTKAAAAEGVRAVTETADEALHGTEPSRPEGEATRTENDIGAAPQR